MKRTEDVVTDDALAKVHANANFGDLSKRDVVDEGVLSYAFGYTTGHTMMTILREHGLITRPYGYSASLTKKGREYLRAMFSGIPLSKIAALRHQPSETV